MRALGVWAVAVALGASVGCGGVSEERVSALEAQLKQMQSKNEGDAIASTTALQQQVAATAASNDERFKKLEEMVEFLQREVSAASSSKEPPKAGGSEWEAVETLLGIQGTPPQADGDKFTVSRAWLLLQLRAMAASGKGPKLTAGKDTGVSIKAIKPKSMPDLLGLKNADIILAVAGNQVATVDELYAALRAAKSPLDVKVSRKKKEVTLNYTLSE